MASTTNFAEAPPRPRVLVRDAEQLGLAGWIHRHVAGDALDPSLDVLVDQPDVSEQPLERRLVEDHRPSRPQHEVETRREAERRLLELRQLLASDGEPSSAPESDPGIRPSNEGHARVVAKDNGIELDAEIEIATRSDRKRRGEVARE